MQSVDLFPSHDNTSACQHSIRYYNVPAKTTELLMLASIVVNGMNTSIISGLVSTNQSVMAVGTGVVRMHDPVAA
jgi:hypothetical protein